MNSADNNTGGNPFAPPQAQVADVALPVGAADGLQLAARSTRFWAAMLDGVLVLLLLWVASQVTPWNPFRPNSSSLWSAQPANAFGGMVCFLAIHGYLLATRGQTLGKRLLNIRIVRSDGSHPNLARLIGLRYGIGSVMNLVPAISQLFALVDCLLVFRESRRCLHDSIADTIVVKA